MDEIFKQNNEAALSQVVTMGILLEYTDEFLIPRFSELVDDKIKAALTVFEHKLKDYVDRKFVEQRAEIRTEIKTTIPDWYRTDSVRDKKFKKKIVEIFKTRKIASPADVCYLAENI